MSIVSHAQTMYLPFPVLSYRFLIAHPAVLWRILKWLGLATPSKILCVTGAKRSSFIWNSYSVYVFFLSSVNNCQMEDASNRDRVAGSWRTRAQEA